MEEEQKLCLDSVNKVFDFINGYRETSEEVNKTYNEITEFLDKKLNYMHLNRFQRSRYYIAKLDCENVIVRFNGEFFSFEGLNYKYSAFDWIGEAIPIECWDHKKFTKLHYDNKLN